MREKQIEEIADKLCTTSYFCPTENWDSCSQADGEYCDRCRKLAERLYNAGYRKQSVGEWVIEVKHFFDDYGDLRIYAIAHCSQCKTPYQNNKDIDYERIERPENLNYYADWNIDVEPIKKRFLEKVKTKKGLHKYCHECGAKMKGGAE